MNHIYLDANATTRMDDRVRQAMYECHEANFVNPASQHRPGQLARQRIEEARSVILSKLGGGPKDRLIFTSGGTEANNLAIFGLPHSPGRLGRETTDLEENPKPEGETPAVLVSSIEHPSVLESAEVLKSRGFTIHHLSVDHSGVGMVGKLGGLITPGTRLVSLMLVNNETGVIQDVEQAARICRESNVPLHCDAVQAIGKIPVNFEEMGLSAMTVTAHKIHGPRGIGGLLIAEGIEPQPMLFGGFQQLGQRPGTEDVALVVGFERAVQIAVDSLDERASHMCELRNQFESLILAELPETLINGASAKRAPHTSNLSFPAHHEFAAVNRQALMMATDAAGVAISTGSACASGSSEPSQVLTAMGCPEDVIESSVRVSFSGRSTSEEINEAANRIINAVKRLRRQKSPRK